jgi:predicted DCC family thiol-disulfide oxidoreductase YuxK
MEHTHARVADPPPRTLLIYDGHCGFCLWWLARWRRRIGDRIDYTPSQETKKRYPELGPERYARSIQLVEPDGTVYEGAEAAFRALARGPGGGRPLWAYENLPVVSAVTERGYRFVSRHRTGLHRLTLWTWGRDPLHIPKARRLIMPALGTILALGVTALLFRRRRR